MYKNKSFLSGTLSVIILALLRENGEMYGYEICQKTKISSQDQIQLTEGAIYPALHKLEKLDLIVSRRQKINGRFRKYYQLRKDRASDINELIEELQIFTLSIQKILSPKFL